MTDKPSLKNATAETDYEKNQHANRLLAWSHSIRYKRILTVLDTLLQGPEGQSALEIIELGCAHGKLFNFLNDRYDLDYTGIEIQAHFADTAQARYAGHHNFRLYKGDALDILPTLEISGRNRKTAIVALETMEHIKAGDVVRLLECIAAKKPDIFICSVPVEVGPAIFLKNFSALLTGYNRDQEYTWPETLWASIYKLDKIPVHNPLGKGHKGFDWRWLTQTIRYNMEILGVYGSPFAFLPPALSVSVFIVAAPKKKA